MTHFNEHDLDRARDLERRLDRDAEQEPHRLRRVRRRPRYFSGLMFRPVPTTNNQEYAP